MKTNSTTRVALGITSILIVLISCRATHHTTIYQQLPNGEYVEVKKDQQHVAAVDTRVVVVKDTQKVIIADTQRVLVKDTQRIFIVRDKERTNPRGTGGTTAFDEASRKEKERLEKEAKEKAE